ncbi:hypothetical protein OE300_21225 [Pseudomonas aeruginosa]|nr:hypothetical protein [Pseudomonas aeruginosa]
MADVRPTKLQNDGNGYGSLREFADGDTVPLALGGTGAATAAGARTSLGLGSAAVRAALGSTGALYSRDSILGAVSQSSGVPTGAVIQRGSNANGEYVRYADGTQICWLLSFRITQSGSSSTILERPWSFPASFSNTDVVTLVSHSNNGSRRNELNIANFKRAFSDTNTGSGSVNIGMEFTSGVIASSWIDVPVYAIGRWY